MMLVNEASSVRVSVSSTATGASFDALNDIVKKALKLDVPSEAVKVIVMRSCSLRRACRL